MTSHVCSICLDGEADIVTGCGHTFHESCLFRWVIKKPRQRRRLYHYVGNLVPLNGTCPDCRGKISPIFDMENCELDRRRRSLLQFLSCTYRVTGDKWVLP